MFVLEKSRRAVSSPLRTLPSAERQQNTNFGLSVRLFAREVGSLFLLSPSLWRKIFNKRKSQREQNKTRVSKGISFGSFTMDVQLSTFVMKFFFSQFQCYYLSFSLMITKHVC